ncbi:MAG: radical SAM protein [Pseudonocardiaceae bacterium]
MGTTLSVPERLKFCLLAAGITITDAATAVIREANGDRAMTPADYASTSGVILQLDGDVWVNAPIAEYNSNFVSTSPFRLDRSSDSFVVYGNGMESRARFWLPPLYHGQLGANGKPLNNYVFTHADRVRLSPITGCTMTCEFCNIPYEDRYSTKSVDAMLVAVHSALQDSLQPARHLLVSGGTPSRRDVNYLREVYRRVLAEFPEISIDIMMVPVEGLFDLHELDELGLNELSINIEIFNRAIGASLMRQKHRQGMEYYLNFLAQAAEVLGPGRVRSMLMVGLEPMVDTLDGVRAIVERGCVPVLSPFRPDPATPLRATEPPSADQLEQTYLRAREIASAAGISVGPACPPCSHNTLTFVGSASQPAVYLHPQPTMV